MIIDASKYLVNLHKWQYRFKMYQRMQNRKMFCNAVLLTVAIIVTNYQGFKEVNRIRKKYQI